jgi:hypothetical protein
LQPAKLITVDDLDKPSVLDRLPSLDNLDAPATPTNNNNNLQSKIPAAPFVANPSEEQSRKANHRLEP